jgi:hypothetical protein
MPKARLARFNCFSPPVMLATLIIETGLAIYTLWRYKISTLTRLAVALLVLLAVFQLSEYHVCTATGSAGSWSRLGYVAITLLPPLGLHLLHVLAGKSRRRLVAATYAIAAGFVGYFLTYHAAFTGYHCTGNYVIFQIGHGPALAYAAYYYGWLILTIGLAGRWANELLKKGRSTVPRLRAVQALIIGYLVFLVPTTVANTVKPSTLSGIPSIMCGFAVLFAFILALYIVPRVTAKRK